MTINMYREIEVSKGKSDVCTSTQAKFYVYFYIYIYIFIQVYLYMYLYMCVKVLYSAVSSERSTLVCHCRLSAKINKATPHTFYIYYPHSEQYGGTLCCAKDASWKNKTKNKKNGWRGER